MPHVGPTYATVTAPLCSDALSYDMEQTDDDKSLIHKTWPIKNEFDNNIDYWLVVNLEVELYSLSFA